MKPPAIRKPERLHPLWRALARTTSSVGFGAKTLLFLGAAAAAAMFFAGYADRLRESRPMEVRARHFDHLLQPEEPPPAPQCRSEACNVRQAPLRPWVAASGLTQVMVDVVLPPVERIDAPAGGWIENLAGGAQIPSIYADANNEIEHAKKIESLTLLELIDASGNRSVVRPKQQGTVRATAAPEIDNGRRRVWRGVDGITQHGASGSTIGGWPQVVSPKARRYTMVEFQPLPDRIAIVVPAAAVAAVQVGDPLALFANSAQLPTFVDSGAVLSDNAWFGFVVQRDEIADSRVRFTLQMGDFNSLPYANAVWFMQSLSLGNTYEPMPERMLMWTWASPGLKPVPGRTYADVINKGMAQTLRPSAAWRVAPSALDGSCVVADRPDPQNGCVWVAVRGVAVPVQVRVQMQINDEALIQERAMQGGSSIAAEHWSNLDANVRREFIAPARTDGNLSVAVIQRTSAVLMRSASNAGALKAGVAVRVAQPASATGAP